LPPVYALGHDSIAKQVEVHLLPSTKGPTTSHLADEQAHWLFATSSKYLAR